MGIVKRMLLFIFLPTIIGVLVLGSASYWLAKDALLKSGQSAIEFDTKHSVAQIQEKFSNMEETVMSIHDILVASPNLDRVLLRKILVTVADRAKMLSVYVGFADKAMIMSDEEPVPSDYDPTSRDWYKAASKLKSGAVAYSEAYEDAINKKVVITVSTPIFADNKLLGVAAIDVELTDLRNLMASFKATENGYAGLLDTADAFVYHRKYKTTEKMAEVDGGILKPVLDKMKAGKGVLVQTANATGSENMYFSYKIPHLEWIFFLAVPVNDFLKPVVVIRNTSAVIVLLLAVVLSVFILLFARKTKRTISELVLQAEAIASGDLTVVGSERGSKKQSGGDEFNHMFNAFTTMGANLRRLVSETKVTASRLVESSGQVNSNAEQMTQAAQHVTEITVEIADKSRAQNDEVEVTQKEIDTISKGINLVKSNSDNAVQLADQSSRTVEEGRRALKALVDKVRNIGDATGDVETVIMRISDGSEKVQQIIEMVMQIAGQTNLLALNAAIEAARAGEHGRGFAVVAEEVRKLAEQSEKAAHEVSVLINSNNADIAAAVASIGKARPEVDAGMEVATDADNNFEEINKAISDIVLKIREVDQVASQLDQNKEVIVAAIGKVAQSSETIANGTMGVSSAAEEQLAAVEEIAASNRSLNEMAESMRRSVERFKV